MAGNTISPLDAALREVVTPALRAEGWRKNSATYTWLAGNGDRAILTFHRFIGTSAQRSTFCVEAGLLPLPAYEMMSQSRPMSKNPQAAEAIIWGRVEAPQECADGSLSREWAIAHDEIDIGGEWLRSVVVDRVAPDLIAALDRSLLLEVAEGTTTLPATVKWIHIGAHRRYLIVDTGSFDVLDQLIEQERTEPYQDRAGHLSGLIALFTYLARRYPARYEALAEEVAAMRDDVAAIRTREDEAVAAALAERNRNRTR